MIFRWISLFSVIGCSMCVYSIMSSIPGWSHEVALVIALTTLLFPSDHSLVDVVVSIQYHAMKFSYYLGIMLIWGLGPPHEASGIRLYFGLCAIFFGFHANSLLPFHYALIGFLGYFHGGVDWSWWELLFKKQPVLFLLPIFFWGYKELITPRHGPYREYNRVKFTVPRLIFGMGGAFYYPYWKTLIKILREMKHFPWITMGISLFWLASFPLVSGGELVLMAPFLKMIWGGVFLTLSGSFAYAVVGLGHPMQGIGTRYNLLLATPMSLMVTGIGGLIISKFFPARGDLLIILAIGWLLVLWGHWMMIYGCYFYESVKYDAFKNALKNISTSDRVSWIGVTDSFPIPWVGAECQDVYWTSIFQSIWEKPLFAVRGSIFGRHLSSLLSAWKGISVHELIGPIPEKHDARDIELLPIDGHPPSCYGWDFALRGWKGVFLRVISKSRHEEWSNRQIKICLTEIFIIPNTKS